MTDRTRPSFLRGTSAGEALSHRDFRIVFAGSFLSSIGSWMRLIVLAAYAYNVSHSAAFVGQITFAQLAPVFVVGIPAGALLDRLDRRIVLVVFSALQGVLSFLFALAALGGSPSRWVLLLLSAGLGICNAVYMPAYLSILPRLVGSRDLPGAISLMNASQNGTRVIGPVIAGVALARLSTSEVFVLSGVLMVFVMVSLIMVPGFKAPARRESLVESLTGGFRVVRANLVVRRALVVMGLFSFLCLYFVNQMPVIAVRSLHISTSSVGYGVFYAFFGLGAVFGAVATSTVFARYTTAALTRWGVVGFGVALGVFSTAGNLVVACPGIFAVGFAYLVFTTALGTSLQLELKEGERGRVSSLWSMAYAGCVGLGSFALGPLADAVGPMPLMLAGALATIPLWFYADLRPRPIVVGVQPEALSALPVIAGDA